jgi:putative transposase
MGYINPLEKNYPNPYFFFTATILNWQNLLEIETHKDIILSSLEYFNKSKKAIISGFVIMSNHIHLLFMLNPDYPLSSFKRDFLKFTAQKIKLNIIDNHPEILKKFASSQNDRQFQIWERRPLATELYSKSIVKEKLDYIHMNPCRSKHNVVFNPSDYYYSSARFYEKSDRTFEFLLDYRYIESSLGGGW